MLSKILIAGALLAFCVVVHGTGVIYALRRLPAGLRRERRFLHATVLLTTVAAWMIVLHILEITAWALVYALDHALPDFALSVYFSAVTYTTTGYGDVVLAGEWRLVGAVEALTGILMCGWSTGFFFAVVNRMYHLTSSES